MTNDGSLEGISTHTPGQERKFLLSGERLLERLVHFRSCRIANFKLIGRSGPLCSKSICSAVLLLLVVGRSAYLPTSRDAAVFQVTIVSMKTIPT